MNPNQTEHPNSPVDPGALLTQLQQLLAARLQGPPSAPPSPWTWQQAAPSGAPGWPSQAPGPQLAGLAVAITIATPQGNVSGYVLLGSDAATNPQAAVGQLAAAGWPVRFQQGGYGNGGGFRPNRPGWRRW